MSRLQMTLAEVRDEVGGGELHGDPAFVCRAVAPLERAGPDDLSYVKGRRQLAGARDSGAGALLVPEPVEGSGAHQLVVPDPAAAFGRLLARIAREKRRQPAGVHPQAVVDPGAEIGAGVTIGAGAVVREGAKIGDRAVLYPNVYVGQRSSVGEDSVLHPGVVVMEDVAIGRRVVIHGGTVVGCDGYGYLQREGRHLKVPQVGDIVIGDDVEIGALVTVDRATIDRTTIGRGTKIGDLSHVAHNVEIGEDVLVLPTSAISGSVKVGDRAILAGRAGAIDNIEIGAGAMLGATSVAFKDVPAGAQVWGTPARDKMTEIRAQSAFGRLPDLLRDLRRIKKRLGIE